MDSLVERPVVPQQTYLEVGSTAKDHSESSTLNSDIGSLDKLSLLTLQTYKKKILTLR